MYKNTVRFLSYLFGLIMIGDITVLAANWTNEANTATSYGRTIQTTKKGEVTIYEGRWNIPAHVKPSPNLATLRYYGLKVKRGERQPSKYTVTPSGTKRVLNYNLKSSAFLDEVMQKSSILSYLFFSNGSIIHSQKSPSFRLSKILKPKETYHSNSMGKSLVSYVIGHAICEGYVGDVHTEIVDWPLVKGTLYEGQKLINLLNMNARDSHVVDDTEGMKATGRWYNTTPFSSIVANELQGTKPNGKRGYHYNGLISNLLLNYAIFKSGGNFNQLLNKIFNERVGVANRVYFNKIRGSSDEAWYQFHATPEDYMRIAVTIMEDLQQNTCVGQYLKELQILKIPKKMNKLPNFPMFKKSKSYGGQFHLNYKQMEKRDLFGMDGYGGQSILIDATNSRIVVVNTVHTNYDWDTLVFKAIKNGHIPE